MYAYNYGIQNFNKKYQPLHNVVVFNDEIIIEDDSEKDPESQIIDESAVLENPEYTPAPEEYAYFEVEKLGQYENRFKSIKESRIMNKRLAEDYLIPNKYMKDLGADNILDERHSPRFQVYEYQGRYIAKTVTVEFLKFLYPGYTTEYALNLYREYSLEEVEVTAKSRKNKDKTINKVKKNIFQLSGSFLEALKNNPDISVIFFFSNDGAKIENTHLDINKIRDNEIVFFLEKDDSYNIFGTVARVLTGVNIESSSMFPSKAIARLAKVLGVDVDQDRIEEIAVEHIDYKNRKEERGILYYLGKAAEIISSAGAWLLKVSFGDGLVFIGDTISGLKFGEHRWKYYDKEGNPDPKFSPIFPGLKSALDYLENSEKKKEEKGPTFQDTKAKIQQKYEDFLEIIPNDRLRKYLTEKLQFIPDFLAELDRWYQKFLSYLKSTVKTTLIYLNALFIGIVNSLIEALGGIISLVGMILSLPHYLNKAADSENKSSNISFVFELLENGIEGFAKLFTISNLKAVFKFNVQAVGLLYGTLSNPERVVTKFQQGTSFVKTHMDNIGYVVGYAIGVIIEEVLTLIFTGGAGNIAQAIKITANSIKKVFTAPKRVLKLAGRSKSKIKNIMVQLFNKIKKFDLKKGLETLLEWIKRLISTTKQLAKKKFDEIFSPASKNRINRAKMEPSAIDDFGRITFCPIKT